MKNLKVGKKFIVSFGMILTLFAISVVVGITGIVKAKSSYETFYMNDFKAVSSVYEIQLRLQEALKELMLAVVEPEQAETTERVNKVNQYMDDIVDDLNTIYANYSGDVSLLKEFQTGMTNNKDTRLQVMEYASMGTPEGNELAQQLVLTEYNPQVENYVSILEKAFVQMGRESQESYEKAMSLQAALIAVSVAVATIAFIITVFVALNLTGNILTPVKRIQAAMKEVVKGNLSVKVDYKSGDEFGEMAEEMNYMTAGLSRIIKDIEVILTAMAGGDFAARSSDRSMYLGDY